MRHTPAMTMAVIIILTTGAYAWTPTTIPSPTPTPTSVVPADAFQIRYSVNLNVGDSVIDITNAGTQGAGDPAGNICANVYVFDPAEEMIACCSCLVTPNALNSLSARTDLISNTITPGLPTSIVVKLLASKPLADGRRCDASSPTAGTLVSGLRAWGTTIHANSTNTPATYDLTETEFSPAVLSASELDRLSSFCGFIQEDGSGFGICRSCRAGGR